MDKNTAWPELMLRYVATNAQSALTDLVNSVLNNISQGNRLSSGAAHVLSYIQEYMAQNLISARTRGALLQAIQGDVRAMLAVEAFDLHDQLASSPENATIEHADIGLTLADASNYGGLRLRFTTLKAQLLHSQGSISEAQHVALSVMDELGSLVSEDSAYNEQLRAAVINATSFSFMNGDIKTARQLVSIARSHGLLADLGVIAELLAEPVNFPSSRVEIEKIGGDYMDSGNAAQALIWLKEAEDRAINEGDEIHLCGLLGDIGVLFRRIGNREGAVASYRHAIDLSRAYNDHLNLARWSGNLGSIYLDLNNLEEAERCFKDALESSVMLRDPEQINFAYNSLSRLMLQEQRFGEAIDFLDSALDDSANQPWLDELWRQNRKSLLRIWASKLTEEEQFELANEKYAESFANEEEQSKDERSVQNEAYAYVQWAGVLENLNDVDGAIDILTTARILFDQLGDMNMVDNLSQVIEKMEDISYGDSFG